MVIVIERVFEVEKLMKVPVFNRLNIVAPAVADELYSANSPIWFDPVNVSLLANETAAVYVQAELVAVVNPCVPMVLIVVYCARLVSLEVGAVEVVPIAIAANV